MEQDPHEKVDLATDRPRVLQLMLTQLRGVLSGLGDEEGDLVELSEEQEQMLRALGYVR